MVLRHKLKERAQVWFGDEKKEKQMEGDVIHWSVEDVCVSFISVWDLVASIVYCCWMLAFSLTTATQPRAGILSLMAERWLKRLLPRFLSLKFWISWIWSEIGFSKSWSSICVWRGRRGRGVSVGEQLMEQHSIWKDWLEGMTVWDNPGPPLLPVPSPFYWNLQCSALALLLFPLPIVPFLQTFLGSRGDPSVHVKAYGFSSVYTSPIPTLCACIQEHGV